MNKPEPTDERALDSFRQRLEEAHSFPGPFTFKFIIPGERTVELERVLAQVLDRQAEDLPCVRRPSRNGRYVSFTLEMHVSGSEEVVMVYQQVATVPGVISL